MKSLKMKSKKINVKSKLRKSKKNNKKNRNTGGGRGGSKKPTQSTMYKTPLPFQTHTEIKQNPIYNASNNNFFGNNNLFSYGFGEKTANNNNNYYVNSVHSQNLVVKDGQPIYENPNNRTIRYGINTNGRKYVII